ncbi:MULTISPECIES: phosphate ABC transporter permease PstA [Halomicrobium]|uniref:Phosphate transport system permease protein PstA n=2 Tax=Halomicrobium mukohataei TaxID=57705 RepID=C7NXQ4_HALMD|nr:MULTISPECIES: phosphate ABC transporter permease PstA [Halomicrobium]ACV46492.1 phosphate ABC transporter, inner membrane subunit PstA [Halomicrobium mukohataei DSM 12286]QCD65038.1 phosphate ABC transporter permease PstA [Halomicrobium mukohataei]QFR19844.1 phosphate ABC transporter permease PstA [Halomicrobium sp. ZPS1]
MATQDEGVDQLRQASGTRLRELKGQLFEAALLGATLVGIVSLLILFGYIAFDTFQPLTASAQWYLLYFGTLVAPTAAFTWYARRDTAVRAVNAKAFAVVFGGLAVSLVTYVVADSVSPYDVLIYLLFGAIPPLLVGVYGRTTDERTYTGPAIPVAAVLGLGVAALLYGLVRPVVGIAAQWIAYFGITTLPVAGIIGFVVARRWSPRHGIMATAAVLLSAFLVAGGLLGVGTDPSFWVVLFSTFVVPVGYVVGSTVGTNSEGRIGVLGPFVLIGGVLAGATLERQLAIKGLESYLTPTLLLESWHGRVASEAGVYPQLVGSIVVVGFMAILAFPVGISAAVYLEEYAPKSGWGSRFATLLEVNISNLAGVPSVVYGLLGLALFRRTLGFGTGIVVSAAGTLGLLILPIVVVSAQEAIRAVPDSLREASYGMGASRWQTLRNVVFPEAVPSILTGTILALARAIGETAPLVMIAVATTTYTPPEGLFSSATALPLQIYAARSSALPEFRHGVVPAAAIVLLALMLVMNATAVIVRNRYERDT